MSEQRPRRIEGWSAFGGWFFVGVLFGFAFAAALSVGGLALPFVVILAGLMIWARAPVHALLGLVAGVGALILFIGIIHIGDTPCPDGESGTVSTETSPEFTSCGGLDAAPWLAVGATTLVAGSVVFALAERRDGLTEP